MSEYKVGDRVRLVNTHELFTDLSRKETVIMPVGLLGVITDDDDERCKYDEVPGPYAVQWDNGMESSYYEGDLELAATPPQPAPAPERAPAAPSAPEAGEAVSQKLFDFVVKQRDDLDNELVMLQTDNASIRVEMHRLAKETTETVAENDDLRTQLTETRARLAAVEGERDAAVAALKSTSYAEYEGIKPILATLKRMDERDQINATLHSELWLLEESADMLKQASEPAAPGEGGE